MPSTTVVCSEATRRVGRVFPARSIEHLIDWAEPTIRRVCREVWREIRPSGIELADLYQEGRVAVFLAAEEIAAAQSPQALVKTVVRRQAVDAIRTQADRFPHPRKRGNDVCVAQAVQPT